jgi:hypothetical protein
VHDVNPFWLTLTNIVLGVLVVLAALIVAMGALCETLWALKKRRSYAIEMNRDLHEIFAPRGNVAPPSEQAGCAWKGLEAICWLWRRISRRQ